jgi:hypothetical protein
MMRVHQSNALHFVADGHAASAKDAFGIVPNNGRAGIIDEIFGSHTFIPVFVNLDGIAQFLQFTILIPPATQAFLVVVREHQFVNDLTHVADSFSVGMYHHPFPDFRHTGSHEVFGTLHFHDAYAAGTGFMNILQIAKMRYQNIVLFCRRKNGGAFFGLNFLVVDNEFDHGYRLFSFGTL